MRAELQRLGARGALVVTAALALTACSSGDDPARPAPLGDASGAGDADALADSPGAAAPDAAEDSVSPPADAPHDRDAAPVDAPRDTADAPSPSRCPADAVDTGVTCMDRWEAPNVRGALPLVMLTFTEAEAWCAARGRRLCFDDEWQSACEGTAGHAYPYGDTHVPGTCNDDEPWLAYDQAKLDGWPWSLPAASVGSLEELLDLARAAGVGGALAADHVLALYQGEPSGANAGCASEAGVLDLCGNVEEWTRRRDGGSPGFQGALRGRYWAEARTCQSAVLVHGDAFRFYEIGLRCCVEPR